MSKKVTNTGKKPKLSWLFGGNPKAICEQESQGQKELVNSSQLPLDTRGLGKEQYQKMGIKVIGVTKDDDIFYDVVMPKGWEVKETEHSMWTLLIDDKGNERAMIFYKAAFYDRSAHIDFNRRYRVVGNYIGEKEMSYKVVDGNENNVLFETDKVVKGDDIRDYYKKTDIKREQAVLYLDNNYPEHKDINKYWE